MEELIEKIQQADELCREILTLTRNTVLINMRFLDSATFRLQPSPADTTLATDGQYLYYGIKHILFLYKADRKNVNRAYLHSLFHCIMRHSFVGAIDTDVWDLACDIAVESIINDLDCEPFNTAKASAQYSVINEMKRNLKSLNAERIYRYYLDKNLSKNKISQIRSYFMADDHEIWYNYSDDSGSGMGNNNQQNKKGNSKKQSGDGDGDEQNQNSDGDQQDKNGGNSQQNSRIPRDELEKQWKDISERVAVDMETASRMKGDNAGNMLMQLTEINRERYDYASFLKKFAVMGEAMKINDDEFDYIYYTYGLQLYKKMPLIEPLEYKEVKRIREFVVAIDTSGSVYGELVQKFIQKTYNILKSTESFFTKINLHIIQCDAQIQENVKITSQEEFDHYIKNMELKGFGGTDFRPVFEYVDELVKNGEFAHLKGLIYFTDGYGDFPAKKPDYETAFVFIRDEYDNPEVPAWAIKLVLENDDILGGN